jgi:hypothetical protein
LIKVTSLFVGKASSCNTFWARIILPPEVRGTNSSKTERSKQMDVEARTPASFSGAKTVLAHSKKATVFRCSMATPFGFPVEPEV